MTNTTGQHRGEGVILGDGGIVAGSEHSKNNHLEAYMPNVFKSLVYTKYTTLGRCLLANNVDDKKEFLILQGAHGVILKAHSKIFKHLNDGYAISEVIRNVQDECDGFLGSLYDSYLFPGIEYGEPIIQNRQKLAEDVKTSVKVADDLLDSDILEVSDRVASNSNVREAELEIAFKNVVNKVPFKHELFSGKDDKKFYESLLYSHTTKNEDKVGKNNVLGHILASRVLRLDEKEPDITKVCEELAGYRLEYRSKLLRLECDDIDSVVGKKKFNTKDHYKYCDVGLTFDSLIKTIKHKLSIHGLLDFTQVSRIENKDDENVAIHVLSVLQELMEDVLMCPCDYYKWIRLFTLQGSHHTGEECHINRIDCLDDVYRVLDTIIEFAYGNNFGVLLDLAIDLTFSISVRNPDTCDLLRCALVYFKRMLSLPLSNHSGSGDRVECFDDDKIWIPHLLNGLESFVNFEYLSLNHPMLLNYRAREDVDEQGNYKTISTIIPRMGCYIIRVDVTIHSFIDHKNIYKIKPGTSQFCIFIKSPCDQNSGIGDVIFMSDGQNLIVFDEECSLLNFDARCVTFFEFLFDNMSLTVFLNGSHFYTSDLTALWPIETVKYETIDMLIEFDADTIQLEQVYTLSPRFRGELMKRGIIAAGGRALITNSSESFLMDSLLNRYFYMSKLTSSIHNVSARVLNCFLSKGEERSYAWSTQFLKFLRLLFELVCYGLDFSNKTFSAFTDVGRVNALTLWRVASENVLALLSIIRIALSIQLEYHENLPPELLENIAKCLMTSIKFRNVLPHCNFTDNYHLKMDLDDLANTINLNALKLFSLNPFIFRQLFLTLGVDVLCDILLSIVSVESLGSTFGLFASARNEALKNLNENECIAIFTKRSMSYRVSGYTWQRGRKLKLDSRDVDSFWWRTVSSILEDEKETIKSNIERVSLSMDAECCTCDLTYSQLPLLSPLLTGCFHCLKRYQNYWTCISSLNSHVQEIYRKNFYYSISRPSLLLCRLLLKHGIIFLCLGTLVSCKDCNFSFYGKINKKNTSEDSAGRSDKFGDWKCNLAFSCRHKFDNLRSSHSYLGFFKMDNISIVEHVLKNLFSYSEFIFDILVTHVSDPSRRFLDEFGAMIHNFITSLSIVDILSYFFEFSNDLLSQNCHCIMANRILTTCINLCSPILKSVIDSVNFIRKCAYSFDKFSPFMNYVVLKFSSLLSVFGRIMILVFYKCKVNLKEFILFRDSGYELDDPNKTENSEFDRNFLKFPKCVLAKLNIFEGDHGLCSSLKRLMIVLHDLKRHNNTESVQFETISCTTKRKTNKALLLPRVYHAQSLHRTNEWSLKLIDMDDKAIASLGEGYRDAHPSLHSIQLVITAVFIHLFDCCPNSVCLAIKYAFQVSIQLLKRLQNICSTATNVVETDDISIIRQRYLDGVRERCIWLINNCNAGVYRSNPDGLSEKGRIGTFPSNSFQNLRKSTSMPDFINMSGSLEDTTGAVENLLIVNGKCCMIHGLHDFFLEDYGKNVPKECYIEVKLDIKQDYPEIINFLLHGPPKKVCTAELSSEKISSLCKYALFHSLNIIISLFMDIRYENDLNFGRNGSVSQPLVVNLPSGLGGFGKVSLSGGPLQNVLKLFWYCIINTTREFVIHSVAPTENFGAFMGPHDFSNPYQKFVVGAQTQVLEKICDWYLSNGLDAVNYRSFVSDSTYAWVRMSFSFFSLLFSLGVAPMNNVRYASPIFQHLVQMINPLCILQPVYGKLSYRLPSDTRRIRSIIVFYVSHNFLKSFHHFVDNIFRCFWSEEFSGKDCIRIEQGFVYLWVKRLPADSEPGYDQMEQHLNFNLIWNFHRMGVMDVCKMESQLESFSSMIKNVDKAEVPNIIIREETDSYKLRMNEMVVWRMETKNCHINDVALVKTSHYSMCTEIDAGDDKIPVYMSLEESMAVNLGSEIDLSLLSCLGGKLETESLNGVWSQIQGLTSFVDLCSMRIHFYYLVKFLLWISFSTDVYSEDKDFNSLEIGCCLTRLLLKSLRETANVLSSFNQKCDCTKKISKEGIETIAIRYIPCNLDDESDSKPVEGFITKHCDRCSTNLIYRTEADNFWSTTLVLLIKQINATEHHQMVHYILNCLLTTFTLGDKEIDVLLSMPNLGPVFCELFISCIRKLGQDNLHHSGYLTPTNLVDSANLVSPTLHGMFLYRWLPPLQRTPTECIYASLCEIFQSVIMSKGYKKNIYKAIDSIEDPFIALPHSENFIAHRASADFEVDINGNTLHVTRANNMGGIALFRIPITVGSSSAQGNVNFFILSPGRFGITVAPADCVFGPVIDLFDRNDVVGFMTSICPSFVHDAFAATINYRVGDVLSASFTIEQQGDGQVCLRTELLIAGNSIGSVLEVIYDPITQNEATRRMSLVFIFQDPQTLVYNGFTQNINSPVMERLVTRDTQSSFRSDTASEHTVPINEDSQNSNSQHILDTDSSHDEALLGSCISRAPDVTPPDNRTMGDPSLMDIDTFALESDDEGEEDDKLSVEKFPSLDEIVNTDWDLGYDITDEDIHDEKFQNEVIGLCKDDIWLNLIKNNGKSTSPKSAMMFADSVQLYQSIIITNLASLSGLKDEVVGQICYSFEALYHVLVGGTDSKLEIENTNISDCFSWLCVLSCDCDSSAWKEKKILTNEGKMDSISDYDLPWLMGSSSTTRTCISKLNKGHCEKLLQTISRLLSLPIISISLLYTSSSRLASGFLSKSRLPNNSLLLALSSKCLLACVLIIRVMVERGYTIEIVDGQHENYVCIDQLVTMVRNFVTNSNNEPDYVSGKQFHRVSSILGIKTKEDIDNVEIDTEKFSIDEIWYKIQNAIRNGAFEEKDVQTLDGRSVHDLLPNTKMFSTCDYGYHCSSRLPSFRRHIMRRTLFYKICEHDIYDLLSVVINLCPKYFTNQLIMEKGQLRLLRLFRSSVIHFVKFYDFNSLDYWAWVNITGSGVDKIDIYSKMVDPLYGWQRLLYMELGKETLEKLLSIFFVELLYCILMPMCDIKYHGLLSVVHWMLDNLIRHPLCTGVVKNRFVTTYTWTVFHTLMINCIALPCKLAVVASRISAWLIPEAPTEVLKKMFLVTQYCGKSALQRVSAVCNFYGTLDLDMFTNLDLKRHDHATKLATATLVHLFASTATILMDGGCEPVLQPDDFLSISHYLSIARNKTTYSDQFIRQLLSIPKPMQLTTLVSESCIQPLDHKRCSVKVKVCSSRFKNLSLGFSVSTKVRLMFAIDKYFKRMVCETFVEQDLELVLRNGEVEYIDMLKNGDSNHFNNKSCFPCIRIIRNDLKKKKNKLLVRLGCTFKGNIETAISEGLNKVSIQDNTFFMEMSTREEFFMCLNRYTVEWRCDDGYSECYEIPAGIEVLRQFVSISTFDAPDYSETVRIQRSNVNIPISSIYYSVDNVEDSSWITANGRLLLNNVVRSGISLSPKNSDKNLGDTVHLNCTMGREILDLGNVQCDMPMSLQKALPFSVRIKVNTTDPQIYFGIEWCCFKIIWHKNGIITCPADPPIYNFPMGSYKETTIQGIPFSESDNLTIHFVPQRCHLIFQRNGEASMILDFKKFYIPTDSASNYSCEAKNAHCVSDGILMNDFSEIQRSLIDALVSDDIDHVEHIISCVNKDEFHWIDRKSLLENSLVTRDTAASSDDFYETHNAIYIACSLGKNEAIRIFSRVTDLDFDSVSGPHLETPLMAAAKNGCNWIISYLVCVHSVNVNAKDYLGNTPLMLAVATYSSSGTDSKNCGVLAETVQLLLDFGANVQERNIMGANVLDMTHSGLGRNAKKMSELLIDHFKIQSFNSHLESGEYSFTWPGLLAGSRIVVGTYGKEPICTKSAILEEFKLDGFDTKLSGPICLSAPSLIREKEDFVEDVFDKQTYVKHIENILERIRKAILIALSRMISRESVIGLSYIGNSVNFVRHGDSIKNIVIMCLRGFIDDVKLYKDWFTNRVLRNFVRFSTDYCTNKLAKVNDVSVLIISLIYYETYLNKIGLLKNQGNLPIITIQLYQTIFGKTNLFNSKGSIYTGDHLASTYCDQLFHILDTFKGEKFSSSNIHIGSLPLYSREKTEVRIYSEVHLFDKIRLELNNEMNHNLDFAIHCMADLLNNSTSIQQLITLIVMVCRSKFEIQGYLPPLSSALWNGIHITFDQILSATSDIRGIIRRKLSAVKLCPVEIYLLLQHLCGIIDDPKLKEFITACHYDSNNIEKLKFVIRKLNINDIKSNMSDDSLSIGNYSALDLLQPQNRTQLEHTNSLSSNDTIQAAFCLILVHDRIKLLDHVNDTFRVLAPIVGTILNQPIVEYQPTKCQVLRPHDIFFEDGYVKPGMESLFYEESSKKVDTSIYISAKEDMVINIGPPEQVIHWSTYFANRPLIKRSLINEMYSKLFLTLQSLNRERPYFSVRVDRGIAATASNLKHTLWYQVTNQILNCNPNILRTRNNKRPFMVIFRGEGATDFGGPFQELLTCIAKEIMEPLSNDSNLSKSGQTGCVKCSNSTNSHGLYQDTVLVKFGQPIHPMVKLSNFDDLKNHKYLIKCGDLGIACSSGCCSIFSPFAMDSPRDRFDFRRNCKCGGSELYNDQCNQNMPVELTMYEALGRLFAMCICMMNPMNIAINPIVWKKLLATNLSLRDLADYDKLSAEILLKLQSGNVEDEVLDSITFNMESNEGFAVDLILDGHNTNVNKENLPLFLRLAKFFRLTQSDLGCTWLARGFNAVLPIGRFRMLLNHKLFEFMVCGDPKIDLESLRAHTVSTSIDLKRDLFDVLAKFDNEMLQLFLRFVSGRSRLPPPQSEWSFYVEYEQNKVRIMHFGYAFIIFRRGAIMMQMIGYQHRQPAASDC